MSHASQMGPRPGGEPTGPKKPDTGVKEGSLYEMLDTVVEPETLQSFRDKVLKILERKAAILAELRKIIDHETFLKRLESFSIELENYFTETTWKINNLVSEIKKNQRIPGSKAAEDLIKKIKNLPYLDPEEDRDLINKLKAELAKLSQNSSQLEEPLNLVPRYQLALISEGGNTLEQYRRRVQAALERSDDKEQFEKKQLEDLVKELEGLVREISALEIMQVHPSPSSSLPPEIEACKLQAEYKRMIEMIEEAQIKLRLRKLRSST